MANERINLSMSLKDVVLAMGGGNPGALTACMQLVRYGEVVDPDAFGGGLSSLLLLDTLGIYEERIYMLWNDVCNRDIGKMVAVLRANQLGQLAGVDKKAITHAIDNRGDGIDIDAVVEAVKNRLPRFAPEAVAALV
jgi:hypothetical protein